jgi:hypothetical protein
VLGIAAPDLEPAGDCEVWEENWPSLQLFLRCQTQWRVSVAGLVGLDYGAVAWLLSLYETPDQRSIFEDLQTMESAVLAKLNRGG